MSDQHATGRHLSQAGGRFADRTIAIVLGVVLMVCGLGMGVTIGMLPVGLPMGVVGLLLILWAVFYATPSADADAGHAHGHGASTH